jgi:farnesyl-diphosphate farnesyltransferase
MVAYLLCRIADTIEDTVDLQVEQKKKLLHHFAASVASPREDTTYLREAFPESDDAEANLCFHADRVLREFARLSQAEQSAIRPWVEEMCRGMADFSREVVHVNGGQLPALKDVAELDQYCYYVAGTVGHLLTGLFGLRLSARDKSRIPELESYSTSFGLGLQLTNIIKDAAQDHRRGWSFIPQDLCAEEGIDVAALFSQGHSDASRRVFAGLIAKARGHLEDALRYSMLLPATQYRIRLFCLTSLFFAVRTLRLAASDDGRLADGATVKISRGEVYRILATTCIVAPSNRMVRWYFHRLGRPART